MATLQDNIESMDMAFQTHMKNKNPGVDAQTIQNIEDFSLAYATAIANAIGAGTTSIPISDYVKKSGGADGVMSGKLTVNYGFEAGWASGKQIDTSSDGVSIYDNTNQIFGTLSGHSKEMLAHDTNILQINGIDDFSAGVYLGGAQTHVNTSLLVGTDVASGFAVDGFTFSYKNNVVYHAANANRSDVDWSMLSGYVAGDLSVFGITTLNGTLNALYGAEMGIDGDTMLSIVDDGVDFLENIYIPSGKGIVSRQNDEYILQDTANGNVGINASGGNLLLGYQNTSKVNLVSGLYNFNASKLLLSEYGSATLNWGFDAGIDGDVKLSVDEFGAIVNGELKINDEHTSISEGDNNFVKFSTEFGNLQIGAGSTVSANINTDRDKLTFNKPIYTQETVGITNSNTRLEDNKLLLDENHYILNVNGGIKHFGDILVNDDIGTDSFSSGFSGNGWRIDQDSLATFTNLVVRNRLKVYEFEIQNMTAINGSFWVSANCSAGKVVKL